MKYYRSQNNVDECKRLIEKKKKALMGAGNTFQSETALHLPTLLQLQPGQVQPTTTATITY